ncbi:MAG: 50S ribosomal protein L21 [Dehalococcoidia bacterium]|nr:50S ribosomal protein L21 [Dehalococcoidia bacterium]
MYATIKTGGKQYKVSVGQVIDVERLPVPVGDTVEIDRVLLVEDGGQIRVGQPVVEGAKIVAQVVRQGQGPKITVFKYKPKTRYTKKQGHRQLFTSLAIKKIVA